MRVIIVEDELMLSLALEDMLTDRGHILAGSASNRVAAMKLAETADYDLAVLDVNLKGESIEPVADKIRERGVPIVFVTGYGERGVPERFRQCPVVAKPYVEADMIAAIDRASVG